MPVKKKNIKVLDGFPAGELLPQDKFLAKYKIDKKDFLKTGIKWDDLKGIYSKYHSLKDKLEHSAVAIVSILLSKEAKEQGVHSVRYRVKDPNSLIEKIIRKRIEDPKRVINIENYKDQITDLIGIRILHTFKYDFYSIHHFIDEMFTLKKKEKPVVYYRKGDEDEFLQICKECNCKLEIHSKGYRSIHYIISTQLTKQLCFAEIQVRTIFEEGWSEIDHKIRYAYKGHSSSPFDSELKSLNTAAGHADELGTDIKKKEQVEQQKILNPKKARRK